MKKDIYSSLKNTLPKITDTNSFYYFIGMVTMAKNTESITGNEYTYLIKEATAKLQIRI